MRDFRLSDLPFHVERWDARGHLDEVRAAAMNVSVARAAFVKECELQPDRILMLRKGAWVFDEHRPEQPYMPLITPAEDARAALAMLRECIEMLGPGLLPSREQTGARMTDEAEKMCEAIRKMAARF